MFLLSCASLCIAPVLFYLALLQYRSPNQTFMKRHPITAESMSLLITTLAAFGLSGVSSSPTSMLDFKWVAVMVAATAAVLLFLKMKNRLGTNPVDQKRSQVIVGDFQPTTPANKPETPYRKAA